jgi:hypothetical protein
MTMEVLHLDGKKQLAVVSAKVETSEDLDGRRQ